MSVGVEQTIGAERDPDRAQHLNVLLAEDDAAMRQLLSTELHADGHAVATMADGSEMLEALWELCELPAILLPFVLPDVIIMDVRMPGYSGLHVLAALRSAGWTTPVILITAFGDARVHEEAARLGAAVVFDKPFDVDELRAAVWRLSRDESARPPEQVGRGALL